SPPDPRSISLPLCNTHSTTETYSLSLHDALPIYSVDSISRILQGCGFSAAWTFTITALSNHAVKDRLRISAQKENTPNPTIQRRSEEHTSELQSRFDLVCRLLLEKKKNTMKLRI